MNRKLRVPLVIAAVVVSSVSAGSSCDREVCREGETSCASGGAGGTSASATHGSTGSQATSTHASSVASTTDGGQGGFV